MVIFIWQKKADFHLGNGILLKVILIIFLFLQICNCSKPSFNNSCDSTTDEFIESLILRIVSNDTEIICGIKLEKRSPALELPCNPCRIFTTNSSFNGGLGGIAGADQKCSMDANKPIQGTFKVFLSDTVDRRACSTANCSGGETEHLDWVMKPNMTYVRASDNVTIGVTNNLGLLTSQTNSASSSAITTWLGFNANWTTEPALHCSDWMDGTSGSVGTLQDQINIPIIGASSNLCDNSHALLCIEQ